MCRSYIILNSTREFIFLKHILHILSLHLQKKKTRYNVCISPSSSSSALLTLKQKKTKKYFISTLQSYEEKKSKTFSTNE